MDRETVELSHMDLVLAVDFLAHNHSSELVLDPVEESLVEHVPGLMDEEHSAD